MKEALSSDEGSLPRNEGRIVGGRANCVFQTKRRVLPEYVLCNNLYVNRFALRGPGCVQSRNENVPRYDVCITFSLSIISGGRRDETKRLAQTADTFL